MITVLAFVSIVEDNPKALADYFRAIGPLHERFGARIVKRFAVNTVVVGPPQARTLIVIEYPSRDAVDQFYGSAEYRNAIPLREKAFSYYAISVVDGSAMDGNIT